MNANELREIGRYEVRRLIAKGGMAWVYEIWNARLRRAEALKLLQPKFAEEEQFVAKFRAEVEALVSLPPHTNLVPIYDVGQDEPTRCPFYTMDLVDGQNLSEILDEKGPIPWQRAVEVFRQVLNALETVHDHNGTIHRDIKPSNIMVRRKGDVPVLTDFGIAKITHDANLTGTTNYWGTPQYSSLEQLRGRQLTFASDTFSLGLTLYRALTQRSAYDGVPDITTTNSTDLAVYLAQLDREERDLSFEFPAELGIPVAVQNVVRTACKVRPGDRYPSAGAMREALARAASGEVTAPPAIARERAITQERGITQERTARTGPRFEPEPEPDRRWKKLFGGALAAVVLLVGGYFAWRIFNPPPDPIKLAQKALDEADDAMARLSSNVERLGSTLPAELLEQVRERLSGASEKRRIAALRFEAESEAGSSFTRTIATAHEVSDEVAGACNFLETRGLAKLQADASLRARESGGRVQALAEVTGREEWKRDLDRLDALLEDLERAPTGTACELVTARTNLLEKGNDADQVISRLEPILGPRVDGMLSEAREGVARTREPVAGFETSPEIEQILKETDQQVQRAGDAATPEEELAALEQARTILAKAEGYPEARAARKGFEARQEDLEELDAARRQPIAQQADAGRVAFEGRSFPEAAQHYAAASRALDAEVEQDRGAESLAVKAKGTATAARRSAEGEGARKHAADLWQAAEAQLASAERALEARRWPEATLAFGEAKTGYEGAGERARIASRDRRQFDTAYTAGKQALAKLGGCARADAAREEECRQAAASLEDARASAADPEQLPAATAACQSATQILAAIPPRQEERRAVELVQGSAPRLGEATRFQLIDAKNRQPLRAVFRVNEGKSATATSFDFTPTEPGRYELVAHVEGSPSELARTSFEIERQIERPPERPSRPPPPSSIEDVVELFNRYWAGCDKAKLIQYWEMSAIEEVEYDRICKSYSEIRSTYQITKQLVVAETGQADVTIHRRVQYVETWSDPFTVEETLTLRMKRRPGSWKVTRLLN
jgi:serine/threonine-protein kinase